MTIFDYLVLVIVGASTVIGVMRGLVREVLSLLSWVVAFIVANAYGAQLAPMLPDAIPGEVARVIVAFIALFVGVRIVLGLVSLALDALLTASGLTLADRLLGSVFGLARGIVLVLALVIVCGMTTIPQQGFWRQARLRPVVESTAHAIKPWLPEALAKHVKY